MPLSLFRLCAAACLGLLMALSGTPAHADRDEAAEARDRAAVKREAEAARARQAAAQAQKEAATRKMERRALGKAAEGQSDAQVHRLYPHKQAQTLEQARAAQAAYPAMMQNMQKMMDGMTLHGKPLSQASDAEIEAWSKEMERQAPFTKSR